MTAAKATVLLVEDNALLRESYEILLQESGYRVLSAGTAEDAIRITSEKRPEIVVLDLGLPDRPGLDVVRAIRDDAGAAGTAVIALTGHVGTEEERTAMEAGCDRYLGKPVVPTELLAELDALVEA